MDKVMDNIVESNKTIHLELDVDEQVTVKYLIGFEESLRNSKAIEAMKVGVIAILSATPSLDTKVVEEKFYEVKNDMDKCINSFNDNLKSHLENYFKDQSGAVPRSLDKLFGDSGILSIMFAQYFGPSNSKVSRLIEEQIGPSSRFARNLDPLNKESAICKIEDAVKKHLESKIQEMTDQFSLDIDGSALARLKLEIAKEVQEIKTSNNKFFIELKEALGMKVAKHEESEKGTEKGREFEDALYDYVAEIGRQLNDSTENLRATTGATPRSKKGDYVVCLGDTSAAPGEKIVIEAKKEHGYKIKDGIQELKEAKRNRDALIGILAFSKECAPPEIGDFHFIGNDFFVTIDNDALSSRAPLIYLEAAYKIARALIVTTFQKDESKNVNVGQIKREIASIVESVSRLSELIKKAKTINTNSKTIEEVIVELKADMEARLQSITQSLSKIKKDTH